LEGEKIGTKSDLIFNLSTKIYCNKAPTIGLGLGTHLFVKVP